MDQYSFQGPYAYRWEGDEPVERIDLRSGERRGVHIGPAGSSPRLRRDAQELAAAPGPVRALRALMAAWN